MGVETKESTTKFEYLNQFPLHNNIKLFPHNLQLASRARIAFKKGGGVECIPWCSRYQAPSIERGIWNAAFDTSFPLEVVDECVVVGWCQRVASQIRKQQQAYWLPIDFGVNFGMRKLFFWVSSLNQIAHLERALFLTRGCEEKVLRLWVQFASYKKDNFFYLIHLFDFRIY